MSLAERTVRLPQMSAPIRIVEGRVYHYVGQDAKKCTGHLYRVLFFVTDVPSYQEKVVVEGLSGPDYGQRFACTLANFSTRFIPTVVEIRGSIEPVPARQTADFAQQGSDSSTSLGTRVRVEEGVALLRKGVALLRKGVAASSCKV